MPPKNSFTYKLDAHQQGRVKELLTTGNYLPIEKEHTQVAAKGNDCTIALYKSGKCLVQGKGAQEWVTFVLEPMVLQSVSLGYEDLLNPERIQPHMGIDESGKGDFFGPMVIAAVYTDESIVKTFEKLNVRDSKNIKSDVVVHNLANEIVKTVGDRYATVTIGPKAYNRIYTSMRNVNKMLAWGHARAIEDLMDKVQDCPRAVADQFGPRNQIKQALMKKGRSIELEQRHKAESDPAVAAASILARATFIRALRGMQKKYGIEFPKGASDKVRLAAQDLIEKKGPETLLETSKCHFRTTDQVLQAVGYKREVLGEEGAATSASASKQ